MWILAERLGVSAGALRRRLRMTIAAASLTTPPRSRIHSFAVWDTAVFLLNASLSC